MEVSTVIADDGTGRAFDGLVHHPKALRDTGHLHIVSKAKATKGGRPGVVLAFDVQLPDGQMAMAQTVVTLSNLRKAMLILNSVHPSDS